jgi:hypothetical protein
MKSGESGQVISRTNDVARLTVLTVLTRLPREDGLERLTDRIEMVSTLNQSARGPVLGGHFGFRRDPHFAAGRLVRWGTRRGRRPAGAGWDGAIAGRTNTHYFSRTRQAPNPRPRGSGSLDPPDPGAR